MPTPTLEGEATPSKNTVQINPLTFDEAALARALKSHLEPAVAEAKEIEPPAETPAEPAEPEAPAPPPEPGVEEPPAEVEPPVEGTEQVEEETDSRGVQKRIDKLTAQKHEAQEKAEALERELVELKAKVDGLETRPAVADATNPFSHIWEESELKKEWHQARNLKRWTEDNVDGCEFNGKEYSAEDIRQIRRNVEDALEVGIPQRAAWLQNYRQVKPDVERLYPFWKDRNSAEYGMAQAAIKEMPSITNLPDYQMLIGDFLVGRAIRLAKAKQPARPGAAAIKPLPPKAPRQPTPVGAPRVNGEEAQYEARKKKFLKDGSVEGLAQVLRGQI